MTRTLIVDDNAGFRARLKEILASEPDIEVVDEAADGREAILKARELQPDLVLMDVSMPVLNGIDATSRLKGEMPKLKVLVLTVHDLKEYRAAAAAEGAVGYVVKKSMIQTLLPAIREVMGQGSSGKEGAGGAGRGD